MGNKGRLFLIPSAISPHTQDTVVPPGVKATLALIRDFLAEDVRTARRYLGSLKVYEKLEDLSFSVLDKDTAEGDIKLLLEPLLSGRDMGVLSESGCPGIADPGSLAVKYAHRYGARVIPLVGPSAIFLALMASGLNGQRFSFHGYMPIEKREAAKAIRDLERESKSRNQTQIFIETPYRNNQLLASLLQNLLPETSLCVAIDVTGAGEDIKTMQVREWRSTGALLPKAPAVFLFLA